VHTKPKPNLDNGFKPGQPKALLNNISGAITGGLWAIMGASGSGKTTFLSVLSLRLDTQRMKMSGDIRINGRTYNKNTLKAMSGYVMQVSFNFSF
jgi:ABC-type multidrug transport system ATPase subunit